MSSCVVIGSGVVGLAIGRALSARGLQVFNLDAGPSVGWETSSRNSEVIHAGIYYTQGSLKAKFCVEGRRMLYPFCDTHGVAYKKCGKLIVATNEKEIPVLEQLHEKARVNGLCGEEGDGLEMLSASEAQALEPSLRCVQALFSPDTGVIDSHGLLLALQGDLENAGGVVSLHSRVEAIERSSHGTFLTTVTDVHANQVATVESDLLVNSAGLDAPHVAAMLHGDGMERALPVARYAKGNYYRLQGIRAPFSHLIYPVPQEAGLGVHITIDLGGQARFGPDVEWLSVERAADIDYSVDPSRSDSFYGEVRKYWPGLPDGSIFPDYAGVRPKFRYADEDTDVAHDFVIVGPERHKVPGLVHLFGIESPGLTSSLAIGAHVSTMLEC